MKKWKEVVIKYCPRISVLRRCMGAIKSYRMATGMAMSKKEIQLGESSIQERNRLADKYAHKYADYTGKVHDMFKEYLKNAQISIAASYMNDVWKDIIFCHFAYGFRADEYFMYGLRDKTPSQRKEYMSDREMHALIIYKMNDIVDKDVLRNKVKMYEKFKSYYKRDALAVNGEKDYDKVVAFIKKHPIFVEKVARENCGRGVRLIDTTENGFLLEQYIALLIMRGGEYLLEERIVQSDVMMQLNQSSVNTVRFMTFYDGKNARTLCPMLRVGREGSFIDNGDAGGILIAVNPENGVCIEGYDEYGNKYKTHPDSGVQLTGFQIPEWDKLVEISSQLAEGVPTVRYVGWDLAYTDNGWCFVEGNAHAQTHFYQTEEGPLKEKMVALSAKHK